METAIYSVIFIIGLLFGSFTNVIIYRMPREESIVSPPSHCPGCDTRLKALDLVPVLSWVFLQGRCRYCGEKISPRYAVVEILCGLLFLGVYLRYGVSYGDSRGLGNSQCDPAGHAFNDIDHGFEVHGTRLTYPGRWLGLLLSLETIGFLPALYGLLASGGILIIPQLRD